MKQFDERFEYYAQYGMRGEPMRTERVDVRLRPSRNGNFQVQIDGSWYRVCVDGDDKPFVCIRGFMVRLQRVRSI